MSFQINKYTQELMKNKEEIYILIWAQDLKNLYQKKNKQEGKKKKKQLDWFIKIQ